MIKDKNCPIGVFDSGVGGLSVLQKLTRNMPDENFLYFGDTLRVPYGNKSIDELMICTKRILDFFKKKNVKAVIVACNTCSANTIQNFKNQYDFEILGLIEPVCEYIKTLKLKTVGLIATQATVNSNAYKNNLENFGIKIIQQSCPELVKFVERGELDGGNVQEKLTGYLEPLIAAQIEKLILGCTHYPFLVPAMKKIGLYGNIFINPADCMAKAAKEFLAKNNLLSDCSGGKCEFFISGDETEFLKNSKLFYPGIKSVKKVLSE